jgi:hypothetical protein
LGPRSFGGCGCQDQPGRDADLRASGSIAGALPSFRRIAGALLSFAQHRWRITVARLLFGRSPAGAACRACRPGAGSLRVRLRASPQALAVFGEVFGDEARPALDAALPPDGQGWQVVTLSFEHELAAAHRLAGFGGQVEVLSPPSVRERLVATAQAILGRYRS